MSTLQSFPEAHLSLDNEPPPSGVTDAAPYLSPDDAASPFDASERIETGDSLRSSSTTSSLWLASESTSSFAPSDFASSTATAGIGPLDDDDSKTARDAARWALKAGYCPIPIPRREKNPGTIGWPDLRVKPEEIDRKFAADGNIGLILGAPSKNLLDVDLDCAEALRLADDFLPRTALVHGRLTKPRSHHFYIGDEAGATVQFKDPVKKDMLAELRSTGGQTVIPPSVHPSGERLQWTQRELPAAVVFADLREVVSRLAAASLLVRYYPAKSRHDFTLALAGFLLRRGMDSTRAEDTLLAVARAVGMDASRPDDLKHIRGNVQDTAAAISAGRPATGGKRLQDYLDSNVIAKVVEWLGLAGPSSGGSPLSARPAIHLSGGELGQIVDDAEAALVARPEDDLYQRGGLLFQITRSQPETVRRLVAGSRGPLVMRSVEIPNLVERLTTAAQWLKLNPKTGNWIEVDCPEKIAKTLAARKKWSLRALTGVIEAPTLRPDGSLLAVPGYDESTGLYYHPGDVLFPELPSTPSREEARKALSLFEDLLSGFPFVDQNPSGPGSDLSVAVSAVLTALIRKSIKSAPLHAFRAPKMGSGKSLLADVVSMIATGRPCAVMSHGKDETEEKKRWLSLLLEGDPVICIDNIERPLGGPTLCSILTQETYKDRVLGVSQTASVDTAVTLLCTGNNLVFDGDLTTRVIPCDLDPRVERPEERTFALNLHKYVPEHRGELVVAGLTILRAYIVAGRPPQAIKPYGRFEEWSDWVRSALVWLGAADPCASRYRIEEQDPTRQRLCQILTAWKEALPARPSTVAEAITATNCGNPELRDALLAVGGERGTINPRWVGNFLGKNVNRIEGGLRFERGPDRNKVATWRVVDVEGQGVSGVSGVLPNARERDQGDDFLMWLDADPADPADPVPGTPCYTCRGTDHWTSKTGLDVCRRCHPPANEDVVA